MKPLWRQIIDACNTVEQDIRYNEKILEMRLDGAIEERKRIINLLLRTDISDSEKITTLKSYFLIDEK